MKTSSHTARAASALLENARKRAIDFLQFVNETGSPYHSVLAVQTRLEANGFTQLDERELWGVQRGGKYFVVRNHACIAAFVVGRHFMESEGGFSIVAAHTDSPCLRLRPNSNLKKENIQQVGVECYGGGLWHTWFDRGLGIAGKVIVKDEKKRQTEYHAGRHRDRGDEGFPGLAARLIRINEPLVILPNLAIHLQTAEEIAAFKINKENHLQPVLCTEVYRQLLEVKDTKDPDGDRDAEKEKRSVDDDRHRDEEKQRSSDSPRTSSSDGCSAPKEGRCAPPLLALVAKELQVSPSDIVDWDLCLMDATPSRLCGIAEEFVESPRLDNLGSIWAAFTSLIECADTVPDGGIAMAVGFDHEEVGSESYTGAASNALLMWMERIVAGMGAGAAGWFPQVLARSFIVSSDMAHGVHPNYADRHQGQNKPQLQKGIVLKENANQRYTTNAESMALIKAIASRAGVEVQDFVVKNDSRCGSTVGPMLSSRLGVRTVDIGIPQWAMHSCREVCGVLDLDALFSLLQAFYAHFRALDESFEK
ncbi:aspartyl aminopeptidase [Cystoisospora suis]|uniref:aspartyl aminopeptidase n=1 Tax=Cystoisospora suis TaxID=483139 RepID=A0A2C6KL88_9APIC|nr:aspartyl aminopeptidase [Cystoisospora suis]